jgi:multidrug efflux pump subunit AcrB
MTSIIRAAIRNRQVVYVLTAAAVIVGLHALVAMPRREDPKITIRQGLVLAMYPGATAEQVEAQVTRKVEQLLFSYAEVKKRKTYTTSRSGGLVANVELEDWVTDPDRFWAMLRHDLNELRARGLPAELQGPIVDSNFGDVVAVLLTVRGERYGSRELTAYLDRIDDALRTIPAVSKIRRYGEQPEEIAVTVHPARLAELGLTIQQIGAALGQRNEVREGGSVAAGSNDAAIRPQGLLRNEGDLRELIVGATSTGQVIHLSDVATIGRRYADPDYIVRVDGAGAALMSVEMQAGNNIVDFGKTIHAKIADVRKLLPNDLAVDLIADQPAMVQHRVFDFGREFGIAVLAVILVTGVLLPLRVAAMAAVAIPITVAVTIAVLDMLGIELHQISFAGLVVALGMVVDDAVVVADNYVEKLDHGLSPFEAAWRGTGELAVPVLGATLTIVASFLPMAVLMPGYVGEFIRTMPVTVSVALLSSYLVAMFLTPVLSMAMIKTGLGRRANAKRRTPLDIMQDAYEWLMQRVMPRKRLTLAFAGGAFAAGLVMMRLVPQRFFPTAERNQFVVDVWMPEGTRIESTDSVVTRIAAVVRPMSDVYSVATFTGAGSPRFYYNVNPEAPAFNYGQLLVNTASAEATTALVASLRARLAAVAPEARVYVKELQQGPPLQAPIEVRISGANLGVLRTLADSVAHLVAATPGSEYVSTDWHEDAYGLALTLRQEMASRLGITEATIASQLAAGFDGTPASTFWEGSRRIAVRLRYDEQQRRSLTDVGNAYVTSPMTGARVPVRQVADVRADWQASRIVRRNGVRTLTVRSYSKNGVLASSVLAAVKPAVARLALPDGYAISYGGELENQAEVEAPMAVALGVSLLGIFGILFFQFRTIRHPLIVMVSIPLALFGSALGLIVTRNPFGFTANLGLTALTGVVVRNAIILVEYIIERRRHGVDLEVAALEAGRRRLRPIFLTTMAAAAGVIPMILSGSTLWSPLASVLAVGLVCSMVFTLVVVPVLFVMVERRVERRDGESSVVTSLAMPHRTYATTTLEPAAMSPATAR